MDVLGYHFTTLIFLVSSRLTDETVGSGMGGIFLGSYLGVSLPFSSFTVPLFSSLPLSASSPHRYFTAIFSTSSSRILPVCLASNTSMNEKTSC